MTTYAIGDVHGCLVALNKLLKKINFTPKKDKLWFVGDVVNRGQQSLETLRFLYSLGDDAVLVLGNHDLHLIALQFHQEIIAKFPQLQAIFSADDCDELLRWLQKKPLLHYDSALGYAMVHAGLPPQWDLNLAQSCAKEVESALQGAHSAEFFRHMYGNKPDLWQDNLQGWDRLRFITNCLTRIRFCDINGRLNLTCSAKVGSQPPNYMPWFKVPERKSKNLKIIFGHWAALEGKTDEPLIYPLDSGCSWGKSLTAMRLEDGALFSTECR